MVEGRYFAAKVKHPVAAFLKISGKKLFFNTQIKLDKSMYFGDLILPWIIINLFIFGPMAGAIGNAKGRGIGLWFLGGLFLGVFGVIFAGFMPTIESEERIQVLQGYKSKYFKKCMACHEVIRTEAEFCRYCNNGRQVKSEVELTTTN